LLTSFLAVLQPPQAVATYTWNGETRTITSDDVALEMAPRHRRTPRGEEALSHLIDLHLVRRAATAAGVLPGDDEVRAQVEAYRAEIRAQGRDPDKYLASKNISHAELSDYTLLAIALDRLVMRQLDLASKEQVTNEYRELWLQDTRKAAGVVTDSARLPEGILARAGDRQFTLLDLGRVLYARAPKAERARFARQVVLRRVLDEEAKVHGIVVSEADREQAVARIRARAEAEKGAGVTFEGLLEALGSSPEELAASPVLRAQVIARRLVEKDWPEAAVRERLLREGEETRARWGARRRIEVIWLRATETPNALVKRTFEAATTEAAGLRAKLAEGTTFAMLARVHSDDPRTKLKGGDSGWHHRRSTRLPEEVLAWAFGAAQGDTSGPLRVVDGVCLARVADVEPEPSLEVLRARMIDDLEEDLYRDLLQRADLKLHDGE